MAKMLLATGLLAALGLGLPAAVPGGPDDPGTDRRPSELDVSRENPGAGAGAPPSYKADNPANNFHLSFRPEGVRIASPSSGAPAWSMDLTLTAVGFANRTSAPGIPLLTASGNRVDYDFDGVKQWYVNDGSALEQGFSIAAPDADSRSGETTTIALDLSAGGDLDLAPAQISYFLDFVA